MRKRALFIASLSLATVVSVANAAFTATATGTKTAKSAKVAVRVNNETSATFTTPTADLVPGETQDTTFDVRNSGSISATMGAVATSSDPQCFGASVELAPGLAEEGDTHADYNPDQTSTGVLHVWVGDSNVCQDKTATITVSVTATQSPSPRN